jgi:hypothetical protein
LSTPPQNDLFFVHVSARGDEILAKAIVYRKLTGAFAHVMCS